MDIISHGLWGAGAFGRKSKKNFWMAFLFGVMPDLLSFGVFTFATFVGLAKRPDWSAGPPDATSIPEYVHILYDLTHSFIVFAVVFALIWIILRRPYYLILGWPLHILFDIGTHSAEFFPTPFLWPFVEYRFNGISWAEPSIFIPNILFLALLYGGWGIWKFIESRRKN